MSMKILITGAAGFIGSNLCEYMLEKKHVVVGLDNFATGLEKNIDCFRSNKNFSFIKGDIRDLKTCNKATENIDFDQDGIVDVYVGEKMKMTDLLVFLE